MLSNQDINYRLISAVREGRLETVRELVSSFGLSYSQAWSNGYVLLRDAVMYKHTEVAKLLLTSGSKVNSKNKNPSDTPLHFAVTNNDMDIVEMILDKGGDINAKNLRGRTPLYNAVEIKNIEITELLLKRRSYVNVTDKDGISPLHVASQGGGLEIIEQLLKYGAYINCVVCSPFSRWCYKGYAPLHFAIKSKSAEIVTFLLYKGANVDVKGEDGITPLHIAAKEGYVHIVEVLLNHGACIYSLTLKEGYMPLHFASELGNEDTVKLLLNRGADIDAITKDNLTPLYIATKRGHETIVKLLLQHGANVDKLDKDGKSILHLAVEKGYLMIVQDLLKYCPDINNESNRSSLKSAVLSCGEKYKNILTALLEYGLIINMNDVNNPELLHTAVKKGYLKVVEDLLKYGANVNSPHEGFSPLHTAAKYRQEEVARVLISYGADINTQDKTLKIPIFYAVDNDDVNITKLLLANNATVKDNPELLNIAVKKKSIEIIKALLQHNADINASDCDGKTALHFTALSGTESYESLFKLMALNFRPYENPDNTMGEIARLLLSKGANVDAQTKNGLTSLHAAAQKKYAKVVKVLLEYNANVNSHSENDITPLHCSAHEGSAEITTLLLNKGANINAKRKDGLTALHIAILNGHEDVVKVLLECGAKVDSKGKCGMTPLHLCALKGYQKVIEIILKFGADVNSRDDDGRTALHIASRKGYNEPVKTLLGYGADINITTEKNYTALDLAMAGIRLFYSQVSYDPEDDDYFDPCRGVCSCEVTAEVLKCHIIKMKTANLYVSEKNLSAMCSNYEINGFEEECEGEIVRMMSEMINNANVSFHDILAKSTSTVAVYLKDKNIVDVLKSDDYKTKFPIYGSVIKRHFRKAMERNELLEQSNKVFHILFDKFPELPYDCTEKIFSYLSNEDLKSFNGCL